MSRKTPHDTLSDIAGAIEGEPSEEVTSQVTIDQLRLEMNDLSSKLENTEAAHAELHLDNEHLRAALEKLSAALGKYGTHVQPCGWYRAEGETAADCTCGLDAAQEAVTEALALA